MSAALVFAGFSFVGLGAFIAGLAIGMRMVRKQSERARLPDNLEILKRHW
jgi:hypothetical protein